MLKSKFARNTQQFQAQKIFTDRKKPSAVFAESIRAVGEKPQELIIYYGKGGIGKTRLLKSLLADSETVYKQQKKNNFQNIFVSLDAYEFSNPVNILMSIRNQVKGDCGLFDYALLHYCAKARMTVDEIVNKSSVLSSTVMGILNEVISLGTGSACIPSAILEKGMSLIKDYRIKKQYREEIEQIAGLNEFEIYERLPYYLGLCISSAAQTGNVHVIFLDSYESMLARTTGVTPSADNEEWIQELFLSCETIRIVVASRDRIRWDRKDADWKAYLNQHLLDNLSVEDSRWFLEQVPIREPEVIDTIVDHAGGVPLYLDMCVDIYEAEINEGKALDFSSLQKGEKIIDRYIRHLDQKDKYAVRVLSIPRSFNVKYAMRLLEKQKLLYSEEELLMLCDKSVILSLDEAKGLWKVDESVRLHLRNQMRPEKIREILGHMMECIAEEDSGRAFPYFATILEVVSEKPEYLEQIEESVLEEVDYYANAGYWKEMHAILASETENSNPRLQAVAVMEELIYLRRTGRLAEAEQFGASHPLRKETMGAWYYMYRYLLIQIRHLQGHYEESLREYKALVDEMEMIRAVIPLHIYVTVCMKYADLLFLRGEFDESLALVENLQKEDGVLLVDRIELLRIEGHIYRFLNQFEQAELIYRSAVKLMADNGLAAYEGKLCNNMVEALCRTEPQEAMEWFEKSKDINEQTENEIELGKSYAAASIAQTKLGDTDQAIHFSQESIRISELTGYKSGRAFGLLAMCLAYKESGDVEKLEEYRAQLRKQLDEIGVYLYIYKEVE